LLVTSALVNGLARYFLEGDEILRVRLLGVGSGELTSFLDHFIVLYLLLYVSGA